MQRWSEDDIEGIYKRQSSTSPSKITEASMDGLSHGKEAWIKLKDSEIRIKVHFNRYLPAGTSWLKRWMLIDDLKKTPKPESNIRFSLHLSPEIREDDQPPRLLRGFRAHLPVLKVAQG